MSVRAKCLKSKLGEKGTGSRYKGDAKDFYALRDHCLANDSLFEDPDFPATDTSIFFSETPNRLYEWKRPKEIVENPQFFVEGASRFDVQQGKIYDCWFLAALANLTLDSDRFRQVVPEGQAFTDQYAGIFHFRFWQYSEWVDVVVDDRLPTCNGELVFLHSSEHNEFWSALLEKAYAKLYGSYEALNGGESCEAMVDFTGGVVEQYDLLLKPPANLYNVLLKALERNSLLCCSIQLDPNESITPEGLVRGHAYSITRVQYVDISTPNTSGKIPLLRLRNPWGNEAEWNGPWSDKSIEWQSISDLEKEKIGLTISHDGEFWISFDDFMHYFQILEICNLNADSLNDPSQDRSRKKWEVSTFEGEWVEGVSAGGSRLNDIETFCWNPQYRICVTDVDEDDEEDKCTVLVALMQKCRRSQRKDGVENLNIGFVIYCLKTIEKLPKKLGLEFLRGNEPVEVSSAAFDYLREVSCRFKLPPGTYCIIPYTYSPHEEGQFLLRIFSEHKHNVE